MRTFAIGDIHGHLTALETLLESLALQPDDRLIFLGDYVDRGPDSRGVIDRLIELSAQPRHVFLRGNHDDWMLRARLQIGWFPSWLSVGGAQALDSYGLSEHKFPSMAQIPARHWAFLESTDLYFETATEIFVHGSISDEAPAQTDAHTLMWRSFWDIGKAHPSGKRIVCGHTWQENGLPVDRGFAVCLDTLTTGASWLSALDVASNQVFQSSEQGQTRRFGLGETPQ